MTGDLLERPLAPSVPGPRTEPSSRAEIAQHPEQLPPITLYGDFNCPWSYLAFRRAEVLASAGADVDWRAVEHAPWTPDGHDHRASQVGELRREMGRVVDALLPGERLPYDLTGFVPHTRAAVAGYAEAYAAGVAEVAGTVIFESFWRQGLDVGDPRVLRILMTDQLRNGMSPSEAVRTWGYPVDITGGPISSVAWRLVRDWAQTWHDQPEQVVPVLLVQGARPLFGLDAVAWLGQTISAHHLGLEPSPAPTGHEAGCPPDCVELPALGWSSENGGRWLARRRRIPASPYHPAD